MLLMALTPAPTAKSASRTITDTLVGQHEHVIVGYSLVKGIGDGEPIASERFSVGGHEWVSSDAICRSSSARHALSFARSLTASSLPCAGPPLLSGRQEEQLC